jgi:hypothetical protein
MHQHERFSGSRPPGKLEALFNALDNLDDIPRIIQLSAEHQVEFLPPEASA